MTKYITYKGNEYPVRFGVQSLHGMKNDFEYTYDGRTGFESMLWHGLISGHKHEKKELTLKIGDMEEMLDECMTEIFDFMYESYPNGELERHFSELKQ